MKMKLLCKKRIEKVLFGGARGFASIWMVIMLSGILVLLLVIIEASCGYAASSMAQGLCVSAGNSLLSEYNKVLYKDYGIFALRSGDLRLSEMAEYYIASGLGGSGGLIRMELIECAASSENYPALSAELLMEQIRPIGMAAGVSSFIESGGLQEAFSGLGGAAYDTDGLQENCVSDLEAFVEENAASAAELRSGAAEMEAELEEMLSAEVDENLASSMQGGIDALLDEAGERDAAAESGSDLIGSLESANNPDFSGDEGKLIGEEALSELPSKILGIAPTLSLLFSGGLSELSSDSLICGEYALSMCSNFNGGKKSSVLNGEVEYILYGRASDKENSACVKLSLFELRFPVNLAKVYEDAAKMAAINSAALAFAPVPQPLAAFVLAGIEASIMSYADVETLFSGQDVPFFEGSSLGSYEDYLRILLLLLPGEAKLLRLMDVIQMNLQEKGEVFAFKDYCYGVSIKAVFSKEVHLIGFPGLKERYGSIEYSVSYK